MNIWKMGTTCVALVLAAAGCAEATGSGSGHGVGGDPITIDTQPSTVTAGGAGGADGGTGGAPSGGGSWTTTSGPFQDDLTELCAGAMGTPTTKQCCEAEGWWPTTCNNVPHCGAVITCQGEVNADAPYCECPVGKCFDRKAGCVNGG